MALSKKRQTHEIAEDKTDAEAEENQDEAAEIEEEMEGEEIMGVLAVYSNQDVSFNHCTVDNDIEQDRSGDGRDDEDTTAMDMQGLENTVVIDAGNDTDDEIEVVTDKGEDPCKNPESDDGATSAKDISFPSATTTMHFDTG